MIRRCQSEEVDVWMRAPWKEAKELAGALPNDKLMVDKHRDKVWRAGLTAERGDRKRV
jgi:putative SOS response-associated peptidase YedK